MLTTLRIKNLALVEDLTFELEPGFNAVTGETGAGKSVLIGALNLVLGERADRTQIREGSESCSVEAVFDVSGLKAPLATFLEENGLEPCEDSQLLLKRQVKSGGTNRQFINGTPTTLSSLGIIGQWLVDIHGPHDHQSLLHSSRQLAILDAYGGFEGERQAFVEMLHRRQAVEQEKANLILDEQSYAQQLDLLRHQVREIEEARLRADEEEELESQYQRAHNAARLTELCQAALATVSENEDAILTHLGMLGRTLRELERLDPNAASLVEIQDEGVRLMNALQSELADYFERVDVDPARLHELEERLNLIQSLKRKYGSSISEVIAFGERARAKLDQMEQRDAELGRLNAKLEEIDQSLLAAGQALSRKRREMASQLAEAVMGQLKDLGFAQSDFEVSMESKEKLPEDPGRLGGAALDSIEFLFAPNPGEPQRPLRAIASSGEMARVMLALKTVLAAQDDVSLLIFDEVDANVGGETATAVGEKMRQIGTQRQTLCITHLAPVAARAYAHYRVTKKTQDSRTLSEVRKLAPKERVDELARMLGGEGQAARKHAEALLKPQRKKPR